MSYEKINHLLEKSPHISKWWTSNKLAVDRSWRFWGKCEKACVAFVIVILGALVAPVVALENNWVTYEMISSMGKMFHWLFVAIVGAAVGNGCIEFLRSDLVARRYKEVVDGFGFNFNPEFECKKFTQQQRAKIVTSLVKMGANSQQIVGLRDLDLPNSWWHTISHLIEIHENNSSPQNVILEDVYVQVERSIKTPNFLSKSLRL